MELQTLKNGIYGIKFSRSFIFQDIPSFVALTIALEKKVVKAIIFDMECLELIDSMAIKHLDSFIKKMRKESRGVATIRTPQRIKEVLQHKGVEMFFDNN